MGVKLKEGIEDRHRNECRLREVDDPPVVSEAADQVGVKGMAWRKIEARLSGEAPQVRIGGGDAGLPPKPLYITWPPSAKREVNWYPASPLMCQPLFTGCRLRR